eukprot:CAMPEP_0206185818 /NCGR_PEP_ID=MMETSP0166-20121206/2035_1 /ASSEMBLY_ACC=CAM_ASM_000260 /TAXON_ID=95228 /ORGANISM="Vannella robusta, Strain DIVA3 518/3/11/1/6" /LENGTH=211 /DNA_ID=CAMNT_0053601087 /DNA_START=35 /DNA_END=670 /DNA_ORIENTATION=+
MSSTKITPEQQRAIQVLLLNLPNWKEFYQPELANNMFPTNFMAFSTEPFHKLPHDETWIWNQSNAKVTTELDQYHECTLQKMNTRKRKNCPKAPSFKIWLFALNKKHHPSHLYFLWCEKGLPSKNQVHFPESMNNNSYSSASLSPMSFYEDTKPHFENQNLCNNQQYFCNNNQSMFDTDMFDEQSQPICLDDLSFLRPFMEQDVAMELGWF